MTKLLIFLTFIINHTWALDCVPEVRVLDENFFSYPFGKESRTVDYNEFEEIISYLKDFEKNKKLIVTRTEILVCTSDYRLQSKSVIYKNEQEHIDLAIHRTKALKEILNKKSINAEVSYKLCGPPFRRSDLSWRFVTKEYMKTKYDEIYKDIEKTEGMLEMYKTEALLKSFEEVKQKYPEPFLAKYKPFNGYRLRILGKENCSAHHEVETGKEKGKGTKQ